MLLKMQHKLLGQHTEIIKAVHLEIQVVLACILSRISMFMVMEELLPQMMKLYNDYKCSIIAIEEIDIHESNKYGIIDGTLNNEINDIYTVNHLIEKPEAKDAPSNLAIIGRYILTPDIFEILKKIKPDKNGEIQITDALEVQAKQGQVLAYKFKGRRFDCGSVKGYLKATNHFAKKLNLID